MIGVALKTIGYYAIFPLIFIILIIYIYRYKHDIIALSNLKNKDKVVDKSIKITFKKVRKLEIAFVIALLLFMPYMYVLGSDYTDTLVHREERGGTALAGRTFVIRDTVVYEIEASYDLEDIKEEMHKTPTIWHPNSTLKQTDLEKLDKYPGKFSAYRLLDERIILIFQYVSPVPIIKSYGFSLIAINETTKVPLLMNSETIVYPFNPDDASRVLVS